MISAAKAASTTLANASRRNFHVLAQSHHRPCRSCALVSTTRLHKGRKSKPSRPTSLALAAQKQLFFGTTPVCSKSKNKNENNHSDGNGLSSDASLVAPGQASITLKGGLAEENDVSNSEKELEEQEELPSSLFTVPIVIEMPAIDDQDDEESKNDESLFFVEKWHKSPGDVLKKDDLLCEIATPDFVFGMQIDDEEIGIMGEIHAEEGLRVPCDVPICTIYHQEESFTD